MSIKAFLKQAIPNPVKRAAAMMLRGSFTPSEKIRNLLNFEGPFEFSVQGKPVKATFTSRWIENDLFWHGLSSYEPMSLKLWIGLARHSDVILDIGANTGVFSLVAKTANPTARVWGFEPLPLFAETFRSNCRLNQYDIQVAETALSNFEGTAKFFVPQENQGNVYSATLNMDHYRSHQESAPTEYNVHVTTGDKFLEQHGITSVDLIKIDAEGEDIQVLEGFVELISRYQPDFLIEVHTDEIASKVAEILKPEAYLYFLIDEQKGLIPVETLRRGPGFNVWVSSREKQRGVDLAKQMEIIQQSA